MDWLRRWLEGTQPHFAKGGRYERFYVLYEMVEGFLFSPPDVTRDAPHVRDGIDLKRVMVYVVWALGPCILVCLWNTGYQANTAIASLGMDSAPGWRGAVLNGLGVGYRVKPSKNLTLAGFVASLQNLTEVVSHLSFHVLLLAL